MEKIAKKKEKRQRQRVNKQCEKVIFNILTLLQSFILYKYDRNCTIFEKERTKSKKKRKKGKRIREKY